MQEIVLQPRFLYTQKYFYPLVEIEGNISARTRLPWMSMRWERSWCMLASKDLIKPPTDTNMRFIPIQACNSICLQPMQKKTSGYLTLIITLYLWNKYNKPLSCRSQWRKPTAPTWHPTSLCPQHEGNSKSQLQQNTSFHCKLFKYLPILQCFYCTADKD